VGKDGKSPNMIEVMEIVFNDNLSIIFTNMLISSLELSYKFSDKWGLSPIRKELGFFSLMLLMP
jgi:hypothetical protein